MKKIFVTMIWVFVSVICYADDLYSTSNEKITDSYAIFFHKIINSNEKDFKQIKLGLAESFANVESVIKFEDSDLGIFTGSGNCGDGYNFYGGGNMFVKINFDDYIPPTGFDFNIKLNGDVVTITFDNYKNLYFSSKYFTKKQLLKINAPRKSLLNSTIRSIAERIFNEVDN